MESVTPWRGVEVFGLRGFPRAFELDEEGLHHPRSARSRRRTFTAYGDLTHLARSSRTVWLGATRSTYVFPRRAFADPNAPENLVRALLSRIARSPGGDGQLARMAEVEEISREVQPIRAVWGLVILCVVAFGAQLVPELPVYLVGYFSTTLVLHGDLWRLVTANLLHASLLHLLLNLMAIVVFGFFVGRPLGSARTLVVLGASAFGAMGASGLLDGEGVIGASGVALGLVGSALWLELFRPRQLPAWWRIPRRFFLALLGVDAALTVVFGVFVPVIAWGAHLGGFAAGFGATALVDGGRRVRGTPAPLWLRGAAAAVVAVTGLALAAAARDLAEPEFMARYATRVADLPGISAGELNNLAWTIAIAPEHSQAEIEVALRLAERAVAETGREDPDILDTLAEVQFQLGRDAEAVATIEEAIAAAPDEPYYREQRRRFLGEREAHDRPPAPAPRPVEPDRDAGVTT